MPHPQFDRTLVRFKPLAERYNQYTVASNHVPVDAAPSRLSAAAAEVVTETVRRMVEAREAGRPVILAFGAHAIKNGLGKVLISLMEDGWLTHLATNGAGIIHDWEFAYQGKSSEDVRANIGEGQFGIWSETGFNINLALLVGAYEGLGYGESIGSMILHDGVDVPDADELASAVGRIVYTDCRKAAAAADLLGAIEKFKLARGWHAIAHPFKEYSVQAAALRLGVPFTGHPMFGHDIIYTHPLNHGAAIGRTAERDFLAFATNVSQLEGGVYLSVGSAVMSPMIFEKAFSMSQNVGIQNGKPIRNHFIAVVDLAESTWDWSGGEPPKDNPAYYLRFCKTFSRMGGTMRYAQADNRDFLLSLRRGLRAS